MLEPRKEEGTEKREEPAKQNPVKVKEIFFFSPPNSVFIFVLKNQASVFEDTIRDHSLLYPISHQKKTPLSTIFIPF